MESEDEKHLFVFGNVSNFPKLVEISKSFKNCVVFLEFHCPKCCQIILKLTSIASLNLEFYKFG